MFRSFHKHKSILSRFKSIFNFHKHKSWLSELRVKLLRRLDKKNRKNRQVLFSFITLFIFFTTTLATSSYYDLKNFALTDLSSELTTEILDISSLGEHLSQAQISSPAPRTKLGYVTTISFVLLLLLVEVFWIYRASFNWTWRPARLIKKILGLILFQSILIFPIALIVAVVPDQVISVLSDQANQGVESNIINIQSGHIDQGVIYGTGDIISKITEPSNHPYLVSGNFEQESLINYLSVKDKDTYYRAIIVPTIIRTKQISDLGHTAILFPNNNLVLSTKLARGDLQSILTVIGNKSLKESHLDEYLKLKKEPKISFLNTDEYNKIENEKLNLQKKKFEDYTSLLLKDIKTNNIYISSTEEFLKNIEKEKSDYEARVRPLYDACIADFSTAECSEPKAIIDQAVIDYDLTIAQAKSNLEEAKHYSPILEGAYKSSLVALSKFLAFPIVPEIQSGIFDPPQLILIKYQDPVLDTNPRNYYYTLLHELFHYYSYSINSDLPSFLEEGITDYFAIDIGKKYAKTDQKIDGYYDEVRVATALKELIGIDKFTQLYFAKSVKKWEVEVDSHCGKNCFKQIDELGEQITYSDIGDQVKKDNLVSQIIEILNKKIN